MRVYVALQLIAAESLVSYAGERFDFVVEMDQPIDNYWVRFRGLMDCDERFLSAHQVTLLRYEGAPETEPEIEVTYKRVRNDSYGLVRIMSSHLSFRRSQSPTDRLYLGHDRRYEKRNCRKAK